MKTLLLALAMGGALSASAHAQSVFNWSEDAAQSVRDTIETGRYGTVTSVLIMQDGEILHEAYFNGADAETLHDTRSTTKTLTGMAVGAAVAEGLLDPEAPLMPLFADIAPHANPSVAKAQLTALDLLTMSGPLECDDWNNYSSGNEERMYVSADWPRFFWDLPRRGYPAWSPPPDQRRYGRAFSYCSAGVQMLGEAVQRLSGQPATEFIRERIFDPLGFHRFEWPQNGQGQAHMLGGLRLRTRDLARLAELQRQGGRWGQTQVFTSDWAAASVTPAAVIPNSDWEYGRLWWLRRAELGDAIVEVAAMSGNGGNRVFLVPEWDLTVVLTKTDYNRSSMHDQARDFFDTEILSRLVH